MDAGPTRVPLGRPDVGAAPTVVLASASPRRSELLARLGMVFDVRPADVDEAALPGEDPVDLVRRLALAKAEAGLGAAAEPDTVVLAADTVVVLDGAVLGKPMDDADAAAMLTRLSGRTHTVLTGVAVARRQDPTGGAAGPGSGGDAGDGPPAVLGSSSSVVLAVEATEVTMVELSRADIAWYVATGEPADKAGAYGVQGVGAVFISSVRGSWDNVVGLPLATTRRLLAEVGLDPVG